MQRTICGAYQQAHSRADEPLTLIQAHNVHNVGTGGTVSQQLHWKKKILTKQGLNKCRQNPARQAAVRSFKKYHFTNQDFLLRKYLRSVKKEMKPKQNDVQESSSSIASAVTGACTSISRPLTNNNCIRNKSEIKSNKTCTITQNSITSSGNNNSCINSVSSASAMAPSKTTNKSNPHQENVDISSKHQLANIDEELKACKRKNWPTYGVEQPTYESVLQESPFVLCSNEIKEIINESTAYIKQYCQSIKQLTDIMDCTDYKNCDNYSNNSISSYRDKDCYKNSYNVTNNTCNVKQIKSKNRSHINNGEEIYVKNVFVNGKSESGCSEFDEVVQVNGKHYRYDEDYEDEDEEDEEEDDDDNDDYDDDEDDNDGDEDDDDDDDDDEDEDDDEEDDDDYEGEEYHSSGNDIDCKYHVQKSNPHQKRISSNNGNKSKPVTNLNKGKKPSKSNSKRQNLVVPIDTSDSSSVSSSQDNSSVSTETCCSDIQTIALHENDDNNNNIIVDINDDCVVKCKQRTSTGMEQPQFIKIRNHEYPISVLDNNPTLIEYLKTISSESTNSKRKGFEGPSEKIKCDVESLMCNESEDSVNSSRDKKTIRSDSKRSDLQNSDTSLNSRHLTKSIDHSRQPQDYITIHNNKSKPSVPTKHLAESIENRSVQSNPKNNIRVKEFRKSGVGKNKNLNYEPLLSTICSVEDGLAFLDNQNQLPTPSVPQASTSLQHSETITLYNNLTSCTLPVAGNTSSDGSSVSKPDLNDSNNNHSSLPNSVGSQTTPLSSVRSSQSSVASFQSNGSLCSQCKLADDNLKESLQESLMHLNDLLKSTVILNSLLTGQCQVDITEKTIFNQD